MALGPDVLTASHDVVVECTNQLTASHDEGPVMACTTQKIEVMVKSILRSNEGLRSRQKSVG